ncbi:MAG: saccharopine dehydrogenase [Bacteroidetes bacterium]|nr:MAG: saccharopine dehydrogenase [Bacteroidota bacterium]TAE71424.1 MAG: saccharopine dehydrogenase [Bacteroidota bacterium]TAF98048.1 MAG: saccharopine dehydrogenase [Bacteroidota bacterium]
MKIVLFGAGKSASVLIDFLLEKSSFYQWPMLVVDTNEQALQQKIGRHPLVQFSTTSVLDEVDRQAIIQQAEVVISLLPPQLHILVAKDCIVFKKHLLTASYIDDALKSLAGDIEKAGVLFLAEMGLDPGIDHMSAKKMIDNLKAQGAEITSFYSHCGGLIAPESNTNPWCYKISWNPKNIINAGKAGASFLANGSTQQIPYELLFAHNNTVETAAGTMAYYANRDSLSYISLYGLQGVQNFKRTTLRYPAFMQGWQVLIKAGFTIDEFFSAPLDFPTVADFMQAVLQGQSFNAWLQAQSVLVKNQLDFLLNQSVSLHRVTSAADGLQKLLEHAWQLQPTDKDMVVMKHEIEFTLHEKLGYASADLVVLGTNGVSTAMAATVGLPLGIAAEALLLNNLPLTGLHIPTHEIIYNAVLPQLANYGIAFTEEQRWR